MAEFTGVLGAKDAQPGDIRLGSVPGHVATATSTVVVTAAVVFDVAQGKWKRLEQIVNVAQAIGHSSTILRSVSDTVTVAGTINAVPSPFLRVTQTLVEVAYAAIPILHLSQSVVEVAYRRDTRQSVTSSVHVNSEGRIGLNNPQSLTAAVTVVQAIAQRNTNVRRSVTSTVTVTPTVSFHNTIVRPPVTSTVVVTPSIALRNTVVRLAVTNTVAVAQQLIPAGVRNLSVTSTATVSQTIGIANTVNRITVTSPITVTTGVGFAGVQDFISAHDTIGVSQAIAARSNVIRQSVTSTIAVNSLGRAKDVFVLQSVTSTIAATQLAFARNTNVRISVTSSVHTATPTDERDTENRITVSCPVHVASLPVGRNTNNRISITDRISIPSDGFFGPKMTVNPNQQTVFENIGVTSNTALQNSNPRLIVTSSVSVGQIIGNNQLSFHMSDTIVLTHFLTGGNSNRNIEVHDFITVADGFTSRNATIRQSYTSRVVANDSTNGQGPLVISSMLDRVVVNHTITPRIVPIMRISDHVTVTPLVHFAGATSQSVASIISVTPSMRVSPVVVNVLDTIHVDAKLKLAEITMHQFVHVAQAVHFSLLRNVNQSLNFTQTVVASRVFNRTIIQTLGLSQQLSRSMTYGRSLSDRLVFPESGINRPISLPPGQILVPVVSGTLVDAIVILQSSAGTITLPKPEFNDAQNNVNELKVKRTMTGLTYTFIKSTDRGNLNYVFRIPTLKALELRSWVMASLSEVITLTNWKGEVWVVSFTKNPFEMSNAARWGNKNERVEVEIELEGVKISG